jgi:hypothetical protein
VFPTKAAMRNGVGGNNTLAGRSGRSVVEADLLVAYGLTQGQLDQKGIDWAGRLPEIFLPPEVDLDAFLSTVSKRKN